MNAIDTLRSLLAKATPGPWEVNGFGRTMWNSEFDSVEITENNGCIRNDATDDARLIVAMHAALPALLDVVEAAHRVANVHVKDSPEGNFVVAFGRMMGLRDALAKMCAELAKLETP